MSSLPLELPTIQNWSCHNCAGCCRQHLIEITPEEHRRILKQNWTAEDGVPADRPLVVWFAGPPWKKRYRLGNQSDGACVFLDENGLCRIHAKFGEQAKPLPCRIYPYAFHPAGDKLAVSLRFSCPSVVGNRGKPPAEQSTEVKRLAGDAVPETALSARPPAVTPTERLDWEDFRRFVQALDDTFAEPDAPVVTKLLRALGWLRLVEQSTFGKIRGRRLEEFLQIIREATAAEIPTDASALEAPGRLGRMQFRLLAAQYSRRDTFFEQQAGWKYRWKLLRSLARFTRGTGDVPPLQSAFREVPFTALEQPFGGLPEEAEELFTRYFRVKIQGHHFCGRAYYGVPLVEGFRSLALVYPSVLFLARWLAAGENRNTLETGDVSGALAIADHHHGYSPAFGRPGFRRRVRILSQLGEIEKLAAWYSR